MIVGNLALYIFVFLGKYTVVLLKLKVQTLKICMGTSHCYLHCIVFLSHAWLRLLELSAALSVLGY
jgi:hypothetical protein